LYRRVVFTIRVPYTIHAHKYLYKKVRKCPRVDF